MPNQSQRRGFARSKLLGVLLLCVLPALLFYVVSLGVLRLADFDLLQILRDPAQQTKQSSFLGFLSNVGSFLWLGAAAFTFFRIAISPEAPKDSYRRVLTISAGLSAALAIDDFFLIHDRYIAEGFLIPLYALIVCYMGIRYRETIRRIDGAAFLTTGVLLALSVLVDAIQDSIAMPYQYSQVLEEGFKFLGAAAWMYFCFRVASYRLTILDDDATDADRDGSRVA